MGICEYENSGMGQHTLCVPRFSFDKSVFCFVLFFCIMIYGASVRRGSRSRCDTQIVRRPGDTADTAATRSTAKVTYQHRYRQCYIARGYCAEWHKDSPY